MKKGFTLIELVVVMGIFVALLGIATINLSGAQSRTTLNSAVEVFIADLKSQQLRAMAGEEDSTGGPAPYGVHFENSEYILFQGASYLSSDPGNFDVSLPTGTEFFPISSDIIFASGSGEVSADFVITIRRTGSTAQKTINLNRYGVVEEIE